jgi:hypothetical protein
LQGRRAIVGAGQGAQDRIIDMGRVFRIKLRLRRFTRRHPWLIAAVRSLMIFSAAFGGAYGFIAGSRSESSGYNPHAFAIGASFLFAIACARRCARSRSITKRWPTAIGS